MVQSTSNLSYDTSLDVSMVSSGPPGSDCKWLISITTHGFPDSKVITVIKSSDQQLVEFEKIIEEFTELHGTTEKLEIACLLETMAERIRSSINNNA